MTDTAELLTRTRDLAVAYLETLPHRPVGGPVDLPALREALGGALPETGADPRQVVEWLAAAADPGLVGSAGPRYFGFVIGGSLPAALATDWLVSSWDQNGVRLRRHPRPQPWPRRSPAAWLVELLGLPAGTTVGFVTGVTMANFSALAAARHSVLARAGWDVERDGLQGAPPVTVRHARRDPRHRLCLAADARPWPGRRTSSADRR